MSSQNVELVRAIYELWERNESARHLIDSELEYVNPPDAVETGTRRDRGALQSVRDVYPDFTVRPERFIDAGAEIVVPGSVQGTSLSGVEVNALQTYVWTVRDGRAVRFRWFNELEEALEAVGLTPADVNDE
jgi:ketosteroid isomerase-like protein